MPKETLFIKLDRNVELQQDQVRIRDLGRVYCSNEAMLCKIKTMQVTRFEKGDGGRRVISVMLLIAMLQEEFPQLDIQNIGETEVVVKRVRTDTYKGFLVYAKIVFVCFICFFGASFTIMAFHNDISIVKVFGRLHEMIAGRPSDGFSILELSYSLGLALGIILFFNHIGGRRITKDPTPIEVEMRIYERQVNDALAETADREGTTLDAAE